MRRRVGLALVLAAGLAGCTDKLSLAPLNTQAQAASGNPQLEFFSGFPGGPIRILMPSGENLTGSFSISETTADADGTNFHATVHGPVTTLVCRARLVAGHGAGQCLAPNGAAYQVMF